MEVNTMKKLILLACMTTLLIAIPAQATELTDAVIRGDKVKVEQLIKNGGDVNEKESNYGNTPLHEAVQSGEESLGDIDTVKLLIAKGANVNAVNNFGITPLHWAADHGNKVIAELLIEKGANINAKDNDGKTPLYGAGEEKNQYMYDLLIAKGANPKIKDNEGNLPVRPEKGDLIALFERGNIPGVAYAEKILNNGGNVNETDEDGNTPLHQVVKGRIANQLDDDNVTCEKIARSLIAKGANVNAKNKDGETPLMAAVGPFHMNYINVIELLLDKGADPKIKNNEGKTAADMTNDAEIKKLLKKK